MITTLITLLAGLIGLAYTIRLFRQYKKAQTMQGHRQGPTFKIFILAGLFSVGSLLCQAQGRTSQAFFQQGALDALEENRLKDSLFAVRATDQLLMEAIGLDDGESKAFLPAYQHHQVALQKLQQIHSFWWQDSNGLLPALSEEEAWMGIESLVRYEKSKAKLQRRFVHYLRTILAPEKVVHFFLLENSFNPGPALFDWDREGGEVTTSMETK